MARNGDDRAEARLRVLFVTRKWPPAVGGMEAYSLELTRELAGMVDLQTRVLAGRTDGRPPSAFALLWFFIAQAYYLARARNDFDVIHYGDLVLFPLAWLSRRLGYRGRQVISTHGTDVAYGLRAGWTPALYRRFLGWVGRNAAVLDAVLANSRATGQRCRDLGLGNVVVIPLGVRLAAEPASTATPDDYLLFVGRLVRRKGLGWFVRDVLPQLPPQITLKVAGTLWDADEGALLEDPRVEFLGPVFGAELSELRRRALAVIMPNVALGGRDFEGFGLTALEAGADGGLLLAAALDGIVDAVEDGVTGWLVEPEDPQSWLAAIDRVSRWSLEERAAFVARARARIGKRFNWRRVADDTLAAYRGAAERGRP